MISAQPTQAADASGRLQQGVRSGVPVMIPGAWEVRVGPPIVQTADAGGLLGPRAAAPGHDRERLEREREGGGAPSQRAGSRPETMVARIWRRILHPVDAIVVWRKPLRQPV